MSAFVAVELPAAVTMLGLLTGCTYGLLGIGIVLVYRSGRVINLAHGEIGAFAAAVFALAVQRWNVPYWVSFLGALAVGAAVAALAEVAVVRRLRRAPRLVAIVATLGVGQLLLQLADTVNPSGRAGTTFPNPSGMPTFAIGGLLVSQAYTAMLVLSPLVVIGLAVFLRTSRAGRSIVAAAVNPDAARLAGVRVTRMSSLAWALAGAVSAFTAVLVIPTRGFTAAAAFGPTLLVRALAAAVVGRMDDLPRTFAAGLALGVVEQQLIWNGWASTADVVLLGVILVALLARRQVGRRGDGEEPWLALRPWPPLPAAMRELPVMRRLRHGVVATSVAAVIVVPQLVSNSVASGLVRIVTFAVIGLGVGVMTGLAGELVLGMVALAAVGATMSVHVASGTGNVALAFVLGALAAATVAVVIGIPALRLRGPLLAVTSLSFALACAYWLLPQHWMLGDGRAADTPVVGPFQLATSRAYAVFAGAVLVIAALVARNIWTSGVGRRLRAVRDGEDTARAFGIGTTFVKLQGFALAGAFAGVGGALLAHSLPTVSAATFPVSANIDVVALTLIGGVELLVGPLLGALYTIGIPRYLPLDSAGLAASSVGWLLLLLYAPGGLAQLVAPVRAALLRPLLARHSHVEPAGDERAGERVDEVAVRAAAPTITRPNAAGAPALEVRAVEKAYGGVRAVSGVDLTVRGGEIVGLIGPNGAGKTTLFEIASGFTRADAGTVLLFGHDVTRLAPEQRARRGLVRSFQNARLFPSLTVTETVETALELHQPTRLVPALVGMRRFDRRRRARAAEVLDQLGLTRWADTPIAELSTGLRRVTELACMLAAEPSVLLLDEPSSGLAQREVEAMGARLRRVRDEARVTLVVIEHDIPLIASIADRLVAMAHGSILRDAEPAATLADPAVVDAYLGRGGIGRHRSGAPS